MPVPLLITADDFGIGPDTSRGILELADLGALTSTVLLVTSPYAAECVAMWRRAGQSIELGWHPCLTLDRPVLPPAQLPSLVNSQGGFRTLGQLLVSLSLGQVNRSEVQAELRAQLQRYCDLTGQLPANVNAHHHVHIFRRVGESLATVLHDAGATPFIRRVMEPARTLRRVPGARLKRALLSRFGRAAARRQSDAGFPGADCVLGITDPPCVHDPDFFARWLRTAATLSGTGLVELTCHPGHLDATVEGRDGNFTDGQLHRRQREFELLRDPRFLDAVRAAGFAPTAAQPRVETPSLSRAG